MTQGTGRDFTDEFRREAIRLTQTSGRTIKQVANDLGVGLSTLTRWKRKYREADLLSRPHDDVEQELARLRRENELLRQERDLLKALPVERMCALLDVSVSGYYAWRRRGASRRQMDDMIFLAHIRARFAESNGT
jgi:transposase-like protein